MKSHGCPKCGGDLFTEHDIYGDCDVCIQCGFRRELATVPGKPATGLDYYRELESKKKLTSLRNEVIKKRVKSGEKPEKVANDYNLSTDYIVQISNGRVT